MTAFFSIEQKLQKTIATTLQELFALEVLPNSISIQPTKKEFEGHYTLVVFPYLRASKLSPEETAEKIGAALLVQKPEWFVKYNIVKGFLNLSMTSGFFVDQLMANISIDDFGVRPTKADAPLYMIEYSSPNTNKPLHLGHVRNNLLGYSLASILKADGNKVVKTNIVNDRGVHICKSMLAWKKWGNGATPASTGIKGDHLVGEFYVLFSQKLEEEIRTIMDQEGLQEGEEAKAEAKSQLMKEVREMLQQWEAGDEEVRSLWQTMNAWVYEGFDESYKALGVDFDKIYYESDTYLVGKEEVLRGLKEGVFVQDEDGSVWADLTNDGYDRKILLRADGTSVYMTQDIGTAKMRYADYPIDKMVYVVGNEQDYHFQVLSIVLDKLGFAFGKDLKHFSYGMVTLPNGSVLKSRKGARADADALIQSLQENAYAVSEQLNKMANMSEEERQSVANIVGLGTLKYFLLKVDPKKNILFDPTEPISFNGNTGPFIQYTYARIRSVLRNAKAQGYEELQQGSGKGLSLSEKEESLIIRLDAYPSIIHTAAIEMNPSAIANYVYDLVKEFNQFYHDHSILNEEDFEKRAFRISLSSLVSQVVKSALKLLGIDVPERM